MSIDCYVYNHYGNAFPDVSTSCVWCSYGREYHKNEDE